MGARFEEAHTTARVAQMRADVLSYVKTLARQSLRAGSQTGVGGTSQIEDGAHRSVKSVSSHAVSDAVLAGTPADAPTCDVRTALREAAGDTPGASLALLGTRMKGGRPIHKSHVRKRRVLPAMMPTVLGFQRLDCWPVPETCAFGHGHSARVSLRVHRLAGGQTLLIDALETAEPSVARRQRMADALQTLARASSGCPRSTHWRSAFVRRFQREWSVYNSSRARSALPRVVKERPHEAHLLAPCVPIRPTCTPPHSHFGALHAVRRTGQYTAVRQPPVDG